MAQQQPQSFHRASIWRRTSALVAVSLLAATFAACSSSSSATSTTASLPANAVVVKAPAFDLKGCMYAVNGSVPVGEPTGIKPSFAPFTPDASASRALHHIQKHQGTAMVDGVGVPPNTKLYAGPDTSGSVVGVVPGGHSISMAEPVVWKDRAGSTWLATFIACGGDYLYWASVNQIEHQNPTAGASIVALLDQLEKAAPYTKTTQASLLPITVSGQSLTWVDPAVQFQIGRGELVSDSLG